MTALLLTALFSTSGLLAIGAMAGSWRQYGAKALALHQELRDCTGVRDVSVRVAEVRVNATGSVLRPAFTAAAKPSATGLRAAA